MAVDSMRVLWGSRSSRTREWESGLKRLVENKGWELIPVDNPYQTPERLIATEFGCSLQDFSDFLLAVGVDLEIVNRLSPSNQAKTRIEARIAELNQELSAVNGDAYRGCWLDTSEVNGRLYRRLRWFKDDGKKGCRILKGEELCQAVKAIELLTQIEETTKEVARVNAILAKLEALDQEKADLLAELAAYSPKP